MPVGGGLEVAFALRLALAEGVPDAEALDVLEGWLSLELTLAEDVLEVWLALMLTLAEDVVTFWLALTLTLAEDVVAVWLALTLTLPDGVIDADAVLDETGPSVDELEVVFTDVELVTGYGALQY